jgi:hypothetical protein
MVLDGIPLTVLTPSAILGVVVLAIIFGRLWTNAAYKEKKEEAARWQKAYETERDARLDLQGQNKELLEIGRATYSIVDAMFSTIEPPGKGGAHRVVQTSK